MDDIRAEIEELKEKLASIEHERWADWQTWCHKVINEYGKPSPETFDVMLRWERQIETAYVDLSEEEKQSDRDQVDRYWPLIEALLQKKIREARIEELEQLQLLHTRNYRQIITDNNGGVYTDDTHTYISKYELQERLEQLKDSKGQADGK